MYDVKETLELLKRAVAEKGEDYTYPEEDDSEEYHVAFGTCRYFTKTEHKPACIVGHVLSYVGLENRAKEGLPVHNLEIEDYFTHNARTALHFAQTVQDNGESWGTAVSDATEATKNYV